MRASNERTGSLFSYVDLEARVRRDHPLRPILEIANAALAELSDDFAVFQGSGWAEIQPDGSPRAKSASAAMTKPWPPSPARSLRH
jgi:hypothetical protein